MFDEKNSKIWPFFGPESHNFDFDEKLTEILSYLTIFDELSNAFSCFSLRPIGAEIDGGVRPPPPPSRWWKIWSASGARVKAPAPAPTQACRLSLA